MAAEAPEAAVGVELSASGAATASDPKSAAGEPPTGWAGYRLEHRIEPRKFLGVIARRNACPVVGDRDCVVGIDRLAELAGVGRSGREGPGRIPTTNDPKPRLRSIAQDAARAHGASLG